MAARQAERMDRIATSRNPLKLTNSGSCKSTADRFGKFGALQPAETEHTARASPFFGWRTPGGGPSMLTIHRWPTVLSIALVGIGGLLVSCGGDSGNTATKTSAENSAQRDDVTLVDFSISDAPKTA